MTLEDDMLEGMIDELVACQVPLSITSGEPSKAKLRRDVEGFLFELIETENEDHDGRRAATYVLQQEDGLDRLVAALAEAEETV